MKGLPPLATLRPFEATARLLSFSAAADEICVTQAAVSKQVRQLEEFLGATLILRKGRSIALTPEGAALQEAIEHGLDHILKRVNAIRGTSDNRRLSMAMRLPFASFFMSRRMADLEGEIPGLEFNIVTTDGNPASLLGAVDVAIVLGWEPQPDFEADYLFSEEVFAVCAPRYAEAHPEFRTAADLAGQRLLHLSPSHWRDLSWAPLDWPAFGRSLGLEEDLTLEGSSFSGLELLTSAAVAGMGVMVNWDHLCRDLLDEGLLVRPLPQALTIERNHYLVYRRNLSGNPTITALRDWFRRETGRFRRVA